MSDLTKNKYEFIEQLLKMPGLINSQKEKILRLFVEELKMDFYGGDNLIQRIQHIEKKLGIKYTSPKIQIKTKTEEPQETYISKKKIKKIGPIKENQEHQPERIVEWLNLFSKESAIKYSTHLWDDRTLFVSYSDFINKIREEFKQYDFYKMPDYSYNLYWEKIYPFLFQNKLTSFEEQQSKPFNWGKCGLRIGWQYPKNVREWSKQWYDNQNQDGRTPFEMPIPDNLKPAQPIKGKTINYFEDVINIFKKEIEFRDNDLYMVFRLLIEKYKSYIKVDNESIKKLKGISFYTNTEYVEKALGIIFQMIKDRSNVHKKVEISCEKIENSYHLTITHLQSFSLKEIDHPKLQINENNGTMAVLRRTLMSLCDFSIKSKFKNNKGVLGNYEIAYLYKGVKKANWKTKIMSLNEESKGFIYKLIFPL